MITWIIFGEQTITNFSRWIKVFTKWEKTKRNFGKLWQQIPNCEYVMLFLKQPYVMAADCSTYNRKKTKTESSTKSGTNKIYKAAICIWTRLWQRGRYSLSKMPLNKDI
jgi:hypothetical protein